MKYTPNYLCDLHCHTNRSDGNDSPIELIDRASVLKMKVIAMVDHNMLPIREDEGINLMNYAGERGLQVIPGCEFTCDTEVEDVHIIGLGCRWEDPEISRLIKDVEASRINCYKTLTEVLCKNGIYVTWDEVLASGKKLEDIEKKEIFELMVKKGYAGSWTEAKLMLRDDPEYKIPREKIDPYKCIKVIHESGGVSILAHPYLIDDNVRKAGKEMTRKEYIETLITSGLDGIEAAYTYDKTSYKGSMKNEEIEREVTGFFGHKVRFISGGSDYHGDGKKGVANPREIGEKGIAPEYFMSNTCLASLLSTKV